MWCMLNGLFAQLPSSGWADPPLAPSKFLSAPPSPKGMSSFPEYEAAGLLQLAKVNRTLPYTSDRNGTMPPTAYMCLAPSPKLLRTLVGASYCHPQDSPVLETWNALD